MIKWTTPRLKCSIPPELPLDYVLLTLSQGGTKIERTIDASQLEDGIFCVTLTQEETALFNLGYSINAQVNIMSGSTRLASKILNLTATKNLHDEVIGDEEIRVLDIAENGIYDVSAYEKVNVNVESGTNIEEVILWENPNSSDSFEPQIIHLSSSIDDFQFIKVHYKQQAYEYDFLCNVNRNIANKSFVYGGNGGALFYRYISEINNGGVNFRISDAYFNAGGTVNSMLIPLKIYGVNYEL